MGIIARNGVRATFVPRKRVVGKTVADAGKRRLGLFLKDRTKISPPVQYTRDFDAAVVHAIKNHIRVSKDGTKPRRHLVPRPPHHRSISPTLTRFCNLTHHPLTN